MYIMYYSMYTVCCSCTTVCVCLCSNEELEKFLDEKEGSVQVEEYVRNMDAVSPHASHMTPV